MARPSLYELETRVAARYGWAEVAALDRLGRRPTLPSVAERRELGPWRRVSHRGRAATWESLLGTVRQIAGRGWVGTSGRYPAPRTEVGAYATPADAMRAVEVAATSPRVVIDFAAWAYEPGEHDKVWRVLVTVHPNGRAVMERRWGPREGGQEGLSQEMSLDQAMSAAQELIRQKLAKGYAAIAPDVVGLS